MIKRSFLRITLDIKSSDYSKWPNLGIVSRHFLHTMKSTFLIIKQILLYIEGDEGETFAAENAYESI